MTASPRKPARAIACIVISTLALACSRPAARVTVVRPLMAPGAASCVAGALQHNVANASSTWRDPSGASWRGGVRVPRADADTGKLTAQFSSTDGRSEQNVAAAAAELRSRVATVSAKCRLPRAATTCQYVANGQRRSCSATGTSVASRIAAR